MAHSGVAFGTSSARGLVTAMTDAVCFAYTCAFLQHLGAIGQFAPGPGVAIAGDLCPLSPRILVAFAAAIHYLGARSPSAVSCLRPPSPFTASNAVSHR